MTDFMDTWFQFLVQNGAEIPKGEITEIAGFDTANKTPVSPTCFVAPLTDLGLIEASGEDASSFLHNQLTNDVIHLGTEEVRLAGYCTAKGRLLATFLMWKSADTILLQLPRQIQAAVQKRLQMYVLRAKVKLRDAAKDTVTLGIAGDSAIAALAPWFPALPDRSYTKMESAAGSLIRVADAFGAPRYLWITTALTAQNAWPTLTKTVPPAGSSVWKFTEIHAGVPQITQATQEQFVPQMINFDVIGGVNFKKGCYPGQEIVARTHYLGKVKRRMFLASANVEKIQAGTEIFSSAEPDQPCGMIVNIESNLQGGMDGLVEIKISAANEGDVRIGGVDGPLLHFGNLPYSLPDPA